QTTNLASRVGPWWAAPQMRQPSARPCTRCTLVSGKRLAISSPPLPIVVTLFVALALAQVRVWGWSRGLLGHHSAVANARIHRRAHPNQLYAEMPLIAIDDDIDDIEDIGDIDDIEELLLGAHSWQRHLPGRHPMSRACPTSATGIWLAVECLFADGVPCPPVEEGGPQVWIVEREREGTGRAQIGRGLVGRDFNLAPDRADRILGA